MFDTLSYGNERGIQMKFHHALSNARIFNAKPKSKAYKLADGGGLYVLVMPNGSKYWRYNFRNASDAWKTLAIGVYPILSLKDARTAHEEAALKVARGIDPTAVKAAAKEEATGRVTFRTYATEWLSVKVPEGKVSKKTRARAVRNVKYLVGDAPIPGVTLKAGEEPYAFGDTDISEVRVRHLSRLLAKLEEQGKFETRVRVQGDATAIMGYAVGRGVIDINPFVGVSFTAAFTASANVSRPALTQPDSFGHLLRKIDHFEGRSGNFTGMALGLLALTWVRPGDVTKARWGHIDWEASKWSVPPDEAKMRTHREKTKSPRAGLAHEVPLSRQATALLRELHEMSGDTPYLFPGRGDARIMSENTINFALHSLGYKGIHCAHGFRSSASTLLNAARIILVDGRKVRRYEPGLVELQLDHDDASTRAIYDRGDCWDDRAEMMQFWADMIDRLRTGTSPAAQKPRLVAVA